jgi:replicative DNA helicase
LIICGTNHYPMSVNIKKEFGGTKNRKPDLTTLLYGKVPPQAPDLEEAVMGACMLEKDTFAQVLEIIQSEECFYVDAHQKIYAAMRRLFDKGIPVDLLTITDELRDANELEIVGGAYYLTRLTMSVLTSAHVEAHARIVMEKFIQRELIRISGNIIGDAYEDSSDVFDLLDKAESNLYEITDKHLRKNFRSLKDVMVRTVGEIEESMKKTDDLTGVPSGFAALDRITGGWQRSDLIILAARPSVGKTALCLNIAMNAAMNAAKEFPVAIFSLEMGAGQIVKRMLSAVTEVSMESITRGKMSDGEFMQMTQRMEKLSKAKIFVDDQAALNIFELRAKARRLKQKHGIELIVIDYLQLMQGSVEKSGNREQEISKISRDLKALAKELDIPIIALSQLNRSVETRKESKMPQLSDLRESGALEQDADLVMFLYRPEYYGINNDAMGETVEGETHINIAKHRNGSTGIEKLRFIKEYQKFVDFDDDQFGGFNDGGFTGNPGRDPRAGGDATVGSFLKGGGNSNPYAGIRRDPSEFGGSKMFVPGGFQTRPSAANDVNWDDDSTPTPVRKTPPDEDVPF